MEQEPVHSGGGGPRRASVDRMTWRRRSMWSKAPVMERGADHWKKPLASSGTITECTTETFGLGKGLKPEEW